MKILVFNKILMFFVSLAIVFTPYVLAFDCSDAATKIESPKEPDSVLYLLCPLQSAINIGLYAVGGVLIILILYGGIKALMANGDPGQLEGAKSVWTYAIYGALIILLSIFIIQVIYKMLGGGSLDPMNITDSLKSVFDQYIQALNPLNLPF